MKQTSRLPSFVRVGGLETPRKVCRSRKRAEGSRKHFCLPVVPWLPSTGFCHTESLPETTKKLNNNTLCACVRILSPQNV